MSADPTPVPDPKVPTAGGPHRQPEHLRARRPHPRHQDETPAFVEPPEVANEESNDTAAKPQAEPAEEHAGNAKTRRFSAKANGPEPAARTTSPAALETGEQTPGHATAAPSPSRSGESARYTSMHPDGDNHLPEAVAPQRNFVEEKPFREAFEEQRRLRREQDARRRRLGVILGGIALGVGAFFIGRMSMPAPMHAGAASPLDPAAPAAVPAWSAPALTRLNDILADDQAGKLDEAFTAATALRDTPGSFPGLDLYLANLDARRLFYTDASNKISDTIAIGASSALIAAAHDQKGFVCARQRDFSQAVVCFSQAVANDPFRGEYFYHWAEALRRRGRQAEAVSIFEQAINRLPVNVENAPLRESIAFKMRLTEIELGQGARFLKKAGGTPRPAAAAGAGPGMLALGGRETQIQTSLEEGLQTPGAAGYWWLTAAALALHEERLPDATEALQKAKAALPAVQFDGLASDYIFRAFIDQPQIAPFLPPNGLSDERVRRQGGNYFIDP